MMESLTSTAQLTLNTTANAAGILAMRKKVKNADGSLGLNKITLNDPNSPTNSAKSWDYDTLAGQIQALWVLRRAG